MEVRRSISSQTDVLFTLSKHLLLNKGKYSNLVFSPLSIHVVLSLITAGSSSQTLHQLLSFLKAESSDHLNSLSSHLINHVFADGSAFGGPRLSFPNGLWLDKSLSLKPSFKQVLGNLYKAASDHVDFQTMPSEVTSLVNSWAEEKTGGLVKEILPSDSLDSSTRLVLANAIYFKGAWNDKFDVSRTQYHDFHLLNGSSIQVSFMTCKKKQYVSAFNGFKVLRLPYKQGTDKRQFSMYFFLPDAKDGLARLVEEVGSGTGFLERHIPYKKVEGEFRIPKFKISYGFEASEVLKGLGLVLPFSGEGLTEMVEFPVDQKLYVSSIFHKAFIEVNEEGTEAAAVAAVEFKYFCARMFGRIDFVADHPFLFLVREDMTGVVQFIGQVLNPLGV